MLFIFLVFLVLAMITLTFSLNNVILLFNFLSIIFILSFSLLVFHISYFMFGSSLFIKTPFYIFDTNELILLPLLSTIRYYVFSYDVIHSLGIYSFGIKIDAIPSRFNTSITIRTNRTQWLHLLR